MGKLRRSRDACGVDDGGAIVEFLGMSVLLLIPLLYLVVALARIQAGAFATELAAREAARAAVVAGVQSLDDGASLLDAVGDANARSRATSDLALSDFGFDGGHDAQITFVCVPQSCLAPGGDVVVSVNLKVALPGVPGFVQSWMPLAVSVHASSASPVDGFASGS